MTREQANRLLTLSREAEWAFPTSFSSSNLTAPGAGWVERLLAERPGLTEAARWLVAEGDLDAACELAANAWRLWLLAGDPAGGRAFLATVLDADGAEPSRWRALALYGDGFLAIKLGETGQSLARNEAALTVADAVGDLEGRALGLLGLSRVAFERGDDGAVALANRAFTAAQKLGPAMRQAPLHMFAQALRLRGDLPAAVTLFRESLALNRQIGDAGMVAVELHNLGHVELHLGNVDAAERLFADAAEMASPDDPYDAAMTSLSGAAIAFAHGDRERAATLLRDARATLAEAGIEPARDDAFELDRLTDRLEDSS
jgi:tetratricopeptide (TPR) repeat protein